MPALYTGFIVSFFVHCIVTMTLLASFDSLGMLTSCKNQELRKEPGDQLVRYRSCMSTLGFPHPLIASTFLPRSHSKKTGKATYQSGTIQVSPYLY